MESSILKTITKLLGLPPDDESFRTDLIMHINSVFSILNQLGVGPSDGFSISDETASWDDFIQGEKNIENVKSYVYLKVKIVFDPPQSSVVMEAIKQMISEAEWRLNVASENSQNVNANDKEN